MEEKLLAINQIKGADGTEIKLSYYLVTEELYDADGILICELYGARIEKERRENTSSRCITRITALGSEILRIVKELSRHTVMPEQMEECIVELLD